MNNITIEKLEQIEAERAKTFSDPAFIKWMRKLNVSRLYQEPTSMLNARDLNQQYDFSKLKFSR